MEPNFTSDDNDSGGEELGSESAKDEVDEEGFTKLDHIKICIAVSIVQLIFIVHECQWCFPLLYTKSFTMLRPQQIALADVRTYNS